jgi:hypothetical protein
MDRDVHKIRYATYRQNVRFNCPPKNDSAISAFASPQNQPTPLLAKELKKVYGEFQNDSLAFLDKPIENLIFTIY